MKKIKRLVIAVILILVALFFMYYSFKINTIPPYGEYVFDTYVSGENPTIGIFQLFFDFDSQTGSIEFQYRDSTPTSITIMIPNESKIVDVEAKKGESLLNDEFRMSELHKSRIVLHSFKSSMQDVIFKFGFKTEQEIYPNGFFIVNTYGAENVRNKDERNEADGDDRVKFSLGKYACNIPCFYERVNSREVVMSNYVIIRSPKNTHHNRFIINTYNSNKKLMKGMSEGLALGFLVSSVFLFIQWFVNSDES